MSRPTKVKVEEVLTFLESYFEEYGEESTTYTLMKYIDKKYTTCSWQKLHELLGQLHHSGLVKKRVTRDRILWLPSNEQIIF